jgi:hypothetical protein
VYSVNGYIQNGEGKNLTVLSVFQEIVYILYLVIYSYKNIKLHLYLFCYF